VGIGDNRLCAKLATEFAKPAGIYRLTHQNWMRVMAERPPEALWGIGTKTAKKFAAAGITSVYQLAATDIGELARRFGPTMGPWYRALALGAGGTDVSADRYLPRSRNSRDLPGLPGAIRVPRGCCGHCRPSCAGCRRLNVRSAVALGTVHRGTQRFS
jgi:nucleotidyltransferase/DNA polymerase involved in DNA repair